MTNYDFEVKQRWGETQAYKEYSKKALKYSKDKWDEVNSGLNAVFSEFAECMKNERDANSKEAQSLVEKLRNYISENYYTCTNEILAGLGQIYVADERFKRNIDKNVEGTAEFVLKAIEIFCSK